MRLPKSILSPQNIQRLSTAILAGSLLWFVVVSLHWPLTGDASLMHSIVFLIDRGLAPYRDIADMNLPGAYLPDWLVLHTLGPGALAWRAYDLALLILSGLAMMRLTRPASVHAGFWAAALFALIHGRDGLLQLGQRDLTLATLLLLGTAALLHRPQSPSLWSTLAFGTCVGFATTIKPTAPPFLLLAVPLLLSARQAGRPLLRKAAATAGGFILPLALTALWLLHHHALQAFLHTERTLAHFHAGLGRHPLGELLRHSVVPILPLLVLWLILLPLIADQSPVTRETLLLGAGFSLLAVIIQGKDYPYHRYSLLAFLLPLIALDLDSILRRQSDATLTKWTPRLATAVFFAAAVFLGAVSALVTSRLNPKTPQFRVFLRNDLEQLAKDHRIANLDGRVQCLDSVEGCIATLNDLHLTQATGTLYDEFLFHPAGTHAVDDSRSHFLKAIQNNRPPSSSSPSRSSPTARTTTPSSTNGPSSPPGSTPTPPSPSNAPPCPSPAPEARPTTHPDTASTSSDPIDRDAHTPHLCHSRREPAVALAFALAFLALSFPKGICVSPIH